MAQILVVDDEPNIRELIATILRLEGHEILEAGNGHEALQTIEANAASSIPDLIVLDLAMPGMDGWRFLEKLYRRGLRRRTRVVIVTGAFESQQPEGTGRRVPVLTKPFDTQSLLSLVNEALACEADEICEQHDRSAELARLVSRFDRMLGD